jgi:hypothetical protein
LKAKDYEHAAAAASTKEEKVQLKKGRNMKKELGK